MSSPKGTTTTSCSMSTTLDNSAQSLDICIQNAFDYLNQLWDKVHMDLPTRERRTQETTEHVNALLQAIKLSEEEMIRSVLADLEARRLAVTNLRSFLGLPSFDELRYPPDSIALLKALDSEMNRLTAMREEIVEKQLQLKDSYELLCKRCGTTAEPIDGVYDKILNEAELNKLNGHIDALKALFNKRLKKALQLQAESKEIYDIIQLPTNNSFSRDDLHLLIVDLHSQSAVLSAELLKKMEIVNHRLKDHHDAWIEQVAFRYDELIVKLGDLADKCFRPPVSSEFPEKPNLRSLNESELQKLEEEVRTRQEVYERAKPVYDKLNEWMASWKRKLDTERRVCRASFYRNRAGSLNTKLKERKTLEQKVPRLLNELRNLCDDYVKRFQVYDIVVEGMRADIYAESVMKGYQQDREVQRAQKQFSTPSKLVTPSRPMPSPGSRRNVFATTTSSGRTALHALNPCGSRQLQAQQQTTPTRNGGEAMRRTRKRSFSCSQLSAIYPLAQMSDPRTSSPKADETS